VTVEERLTRLETQHEANQQALALARETLKYWQASTNEWRGALEDAREEKVDEKVYTVQHAVLAKAIETLSKLVYVGLGGVLALELALRLFYK
jgi:hypothetical protein